MAGSSALAGAAERQLIAKIGRYYDDPLGFVRVAYPWGEGGGPLEDEEGPDEWQTAVLTRLGQAIRSNAALSEAIRFAIASGHGIGKTALLAWIIHWFMSTRDFPQIVVTASTQTQLSTKTWREVAKWHRLLINRHWFNWTATKFYHVQYPETWFASAIPWSENNADAFAGTHEKHVLIIYDEANAVADIIWETTEGALTTAGAVWIAFGNYTKNTGRFNDCFAGRMRERWIRFQIDSRTARKANQKQIQQWIDDYGEDSDFVRIRVRGIAPRAGADQFIPQDLVDARYEAAGWETAPKIMSLDVARYGDNQSVAGLRQGRRYTQPGKWRGLAIDQLADRFCALIEQVEPDAIVVDGDGIGGAVVDLIRRRNYHLKDGKDVVVEFHGASPANDSTIYYNRRAEVWGLARDALKAGQELPDDNELRGDLVAPEYGYATKGGFEVVQLESKDDMRSRGVASPDCFVAGTLIATPHGERRIETLGVGDEVVTPFGVTTILAAWSKDADELTTVSFSDGSRLVGTGNHKVFCWGAGVKRLDALTMTDVMEPYRNGRLWLWNLLSIKARGSEFKALVDTISRTGRVGVSGFCIAAFGQITTVLSRRIMMFITETVIGATTIFPTWSFWRGASIAENICDGAISMRNISPRMPSISAASDIWRLNGMALPKDGSGTETRGGTLGVCESARNRVALNAVSHFRRSGSQTPGTALIRACRKHNIGGIVRSGGAVCGAIKNLWRTYIGVQPVAPVVVQTVTVPPRAVYNLTLFRHNAYYANNILVFNCGDAFAMTFAVAVRAARRRMADRDVRPVQQIGGGGVAPSNSWLGV